MNQKITAFLFGLLGTILLICSCILALYFRQSSQQAALYSRLAASASHFDTGELTGEGSLLPEREELYEQNPDMVGWIQIEGTGIDYPVMQTPADPNYYLKHDFEKHYTDYGCPFMQADCDALAPSDNLIIYGHNMKNGSMFGNLKKFTEDQSTYEKSKYFWILTPEKNYRYEIISAYTTGVNSDTYTLFKGPGEEYLNYLNTIQGYSEIKTEATELTVKDKIVTLSTCTGNEATRFVVQGKQVNAEPAG